MEELKYFKIAEVAKFLNVTRKCILNLERKGLVKADKINENGYRFYSSERVALIEYMLRLKKTELTLEQINKLINGEIDKDKVIDLLIERKEAIDFLLKQFDVLSSVPRFEFLPEEDLYVYTKENTNTQEYTMNELYYNARIAYEHCIKEGCVVDKTKPFFSYCNSNTYKIDYRRINVIPLLVKNKGKEIHFGKRLRVSFTSLALFNDMVIKAKELLKLNGLTLTGRIMICSESGPIKVQNQHIIKLDFEYK